MENRLESLRANFFKNQFTYGKEIVYPVKNVQIAPEVMYQLTPTN